MKKLNKLILAQLLIASSIYGTYTAITESYKLSVNFLKAKQIIRSPQDINESVKINSYINDLNPAYVRAHIKAEHRCKENDLNKCNLTRTSNKGAVCAMQITKETAKLYNFDYERLKKDQEYCIASGTKILSDNIVRRKDAVKATKEYNGGGKSLIVKFPETEEYQRLVFLDVATNYDRF